MLRRKEDLTRARKRTHCIQLIRMAVKIFLFSNENASINNVDINIEEILNILYQQNYHKR